MSKIRLNTTRRLNAYRLKKQREAYYERGFVRVQGGAWVKKEAVDASRKAKYKNSRA